MQLERERRKRRLSFHLCGHPPRFMMRHPGRPSCSATFGRQRNCDTLVLPSRPRPPSDQGRTKRCQNVTNSLFPLFLLQFSVSISEVFKGYFILYGVPFVSLPISLSDSTPAPDTAPTRFCCGRGRSAVRRTASIIRGFSPTFRISF